MGSKGTENWVQLGRNSLQPSSMGVPPPPPPEGGGGGHITDFSVGGVPACSAKMDTMDLKFCQNRGRGKI